MIERGHAKDDHDAFAARVEAVEIEVLLGVGDDRLCCAPSPVGVENMILPPRSKSSASALFANKV
jgi:hypothetical protein